MKSNHRAIIQLMKSAITRQPEKLPEDFDLASQLELLKPHHMFPLIYDGAIRCGISRTAPVMQQLFPVYYKAMQKSDGQQRQIRRLREAFRQAEIDHMLLKGSRMKDLYPAPELRYMGDADILIREGQYEKIQVIMEELGYRFCQESDHELIWRHPELMVELHKHLIPSYNKDFYSHFGKGWQLAEAYEGSEYRMRQEDEWIFLFTHFTKHYRDGGIGCRYVADLWVWRRAHPRMDENYIRGVLEKIQLDTFYDHILGLIDYWFEDGAGAPVLDVITEFIFASGSWGQEETKVLSGAIRDAKHSVLGFSSRLMYLWKIAFPSVVNLRNKYKVLNKAPWLLPLVWLYRPFYKILFERRDLQRKSEHLETMSKENIRLHRQMLNLVGLDYNF